MRSSESNHPLICPNPGRTVALPTRQLIAVALKTGDGCHCDLVGRKSLSPRRKNGRRV
ncbi:protein of unknown function [Methylococcus capsulatus]|uniref:Uncharacterized protein n=1 Tax=Methylococcus capsulatus TaxID=414 RepID=A0AA35UD46_METCP|nr:protein of unknown function [Methylococcus capsulatus]